ncbi:MAG: DUF2752 domain-containing protein [Fibromonadaceae bacterium]|jgi:hypothetical protein|nr:DUF2752 domain-containing protein [Fibromonadaceae bacterium]
MTIKKIIIFLLTIVFIFAIIIYGKLNPENFPFFPKCIFKMLTSFDCPGCGAQRTIHYLLNLEFANAIRTNAFLVLAIPYILLGLIIEFSRDDKVFINKVYNKLYGSTAALAALVIIISWWIFRNVPLLKVLQLLENAE